MEDSVGKWFKDRSQALNAIPSNEAWENIERQLDDPVGKWYQERSDDLNVIPPSEAWQHVETQMEDWPREWYQSNAANVSSDSNSNGWNGIAEQLEVQRNVRTGARIFFVRTASMIAVLVMLPLWIANVTNNTISTSSIIGSSKLAVASTSKSLDTKPTRNEIQPAVNYQIPIIQIT